MLLSWREVRHRACSCVAQPLTNLFRNFRQLLLTLLVCRFSLRLWNRTEIALRPSRFVFRCILRNPRGSATWGNWQWNGWYQTSNPVREKKIGTVRDNCVTAQQNVSLSNVFAKTHICQAGYWGMESHLTVILHFSGGSQASLSRIFESKSPKTLRNVPHRYMTSQTPRPTSLDGAHITT